MGFQHQYPYGDVHELNLDWIIQTMQEFINSEREAGNTPTVSSVRNFFTHKYPYGDIHELNLDWVIQTALRMEEIGDSVEDDIEDLQTRMTAAEGNISTLDNMVSGLSDSVDQIESDIDDIQDDVADLETTTGQHTTQIVALDAKIDAQVVANPTDAATDTLNKIKIAGTVYDVEGSGGTEVEPNPAGEPTDTLEKIGIDGTIYAVNESEPVSKTVTGNPITIADAADAPIVSGEVTFEPVQNLHGYDKPWAGGNGKNLLQNTAVTTTSSGITFTVNSDGTVLANGTATADVPFTLFNPWTKEGSYILNGCPTGGSVNGYVFQAFLSGKTANDIGNGVALNVENGDSFRIRIYIKSGTTVSNLLFKPMIRLATETAPAFEPYENICPITGYTDCEVEVTDGTTTNTYTIDLDGTRYGGTVNPVSGVMRVDRACFIGDGSADENWNITGTGRLQLSGINNLKQYTDIANEYLTCSIAVKAASTANTGVITYSSGKLVLYLDGFKDGTLEDWKTYISTNPIYICYELATPFTVQLTTEQIRTLEGTNNISTNMTTMSVEYITQDYQPLVELIERSAGHRYSTRERVVGTWIDGKPVYEKTYSSLNVLINDTSSWFRTGIIISDINAIVGAGGIDTSNQYWSVSASIYSANDEVGISIASLVGAAGGRVIDTLTLRYTKTID